VRHRLPLRARSHALLSESQRARAHYKAAQLLQASLTPEARAQRILELADHFNRALGEIHEDERISVVQLNLAAAERALGSGAPTSAAEYLSRGRALFRAADWDLHSELGFNLWLQSAACAYQLGQLDACEALLDVAEPNARSPVQSAAVTAHRIVVHGLRDHPERATEVGLTALRALGIRWPLHPSALRVRLAELQLALALGRRGPEAFKPAPGYSPETLARLMLVAAVGGPAARCEVRLVPLLAAWAARLMLRKGYSRGPDLALAALASNLCSRAVGARRVRRYATLAAALTDKVGDAVYRYRAQCVLHGNVYPWLERRVDAVEPLHRIFQEALEMGDREYAQYALSQRIYTHLLSGVSLDVVDTEYREYLGVFTHGIARESLGGLQPLHDPSFDDSRIDAELAALDVTFADEPLIGMHARLTWMLSLSVLNRPADAYAQSERLRDVATMETIRTDITFLRGLCAAGLARSAGAGHRDLAGTLTQCLRQLAAWARQGPDFVHMAEILRAERAALRGRVDLARLHYASATRRAQQQGYVHHAALACEREAELLAQVRRDTEAALALERARSLYARWGARAKVARLERARSALAHPSRKRS
jgi:hypothetical protein